tara:strand:- start:37 stop:528 length:492 start_codon:yes stop_codon:yes gene_type:complete
MKIREDRKAKSISFFNKQSIVSKKKIINFIKHKSKNFLLNCRISINSSSKDDINYMIIFQKKNFIPNPKYYRKKDKIFFCNQGKIIFLFFDKKMRFLNAKKLNKNEFIFIKNQTVYTNISLTSKTIHSEVISGPFIGKTKERIELSFPSSKMMWLKNNLRNFW